MVPKVKVFIWSLPTVPWAASDFDAGRMGASHEINNWIPTHISPPPALPIQHKADIGLSV